MQMTTRILLVLSKIANNLWNVYDVTPRNRYVKETLINTFFGPFWVRINIGGKKEIRSLGKRKG